MSLSGNLFLFVWFWYHHRYHGMRASLTYHTCPSSDQFLRSCTQVLTILYRGTPTSAALCVPFLWVKRALGGICQERPPHPPDKKYPFFSLSRNRYAPQSTAGSSFQIKGVGDRQQLSIWNCARFFFLFLFHLSKPILTGPYWLLYHFMLHCVQCSSEFNIRVRCNLSY